MPSKRLLPVLLLILSTAACGGKESAYDLAARTTLEEKEPLAFPGLQNVFFLSDDIISGSEPGGAAAFERLAAMGVKTILSVDGKTPDAGMAAKYGLRYVHVPIRYRGIPVEARTKIAKTFRELPGPFYVHCFHGKHRGPAAAAFGRLVLDGAGRERALAEMRQWCGTSGKYPGLFETIARAEIPSEVETRAFTWDFPAAHPFQGLRGEMVVISRAFDHLVAFGKRGFTPDPEHPDIDIGNEAHKLLDAFVRSEEATRSRPEDFRTWLAESVAEARKLAADRSAGRAALQAVKKRCDACHQVYRNR